MQFSNLMSPKSPIFTTTSPRSVTVRTILVDFTSRCINKHKTKQQTVRSFLHYILVDLHTIVDGMWIVTSQTAVCVYVGTDIEYSHTQYNRLTCVLYQANLYYQIYGFFNDVLTSVLYREYIIRTEKEKHVAHTAN